MATRTSSFYGEAANGDLRRSVLARTSYAFTRCFYGEAANGDLRQLANSYRF